jgi:hypothetical protein
VTAGHGDFCALLSSRGTAAAFLKAGCTHAKTVNRPTFSLSPSDLIYIPSEARSIGNRFITHIWAKGGRELVGDEARNLLKPVWKTDHGTLGVTEAQRTALDVRPEEFQMNRAIMLRFCAAWLLFGVRAQMKEMTDRARLQVT